MSIKKLSKIRKNDPHFQREAAKYPMPLPSREYVVQVLADQGRPVSFDRRAKIRLDMQFRARGF